MTAPAATTPLALVPLRTPTQSGLREQSCPIPFSPPSMPAQAPLVLSITTFANLENACGFHVKQLDILRSTALTAQKHIWYLASAFPWEEWKMFLHLLQRLTREST